MNRDLERGRGILSKADREYLLGEAEMEHEQSKRNAEARIRNRVTNSILDFNLLVHELKKKDRQQIFQNASDDSEFVDGLTAMLSFAYMGLKETGVDFEHILQPAIRKSEGAYAAEVLGSSVTVDVTFDVETTLETEVDDVIPRIVDGRPVSPRELFAVLASGESIPENVEKILLDKTEGLTGDTDVFIERLARFLDAEVRTVTSYRVALDLPE